MTVVLIELHFDSARLLTDVLEGIGHEIVPVSYTHLTLPTT